MFRIIIKVLFDIFVCIAGNKIQGSSDLPKDQVSFVLEKTEVISI